jgi:hypothetical protein
MKVVETTNKVVPFSTLVAGTIFTPVGDGAYFMSTTNARDCDYPSDLELYNAVSLEDDNESGTLVHFDDDEKVIPFYDCVLTVK